LIGIFDCAEEAVKRPPFLIPSETESREMQWLQARQFFHPRHFLNREESPLARQKFPDAKSPEFESP
jgi:hypothetical protein